MKLSMQITFDKKGEILLPVVRDNAGLKAKYYRQLKKLLSGQIKGSARTIAALINSGDEQKIMNAVRDASRKAQQKFNEDAEALAFSFSNGVSEDAKRRFSGGIEKATGMKLSKDFMSRAGAAVLADATEENVSLIRSIPEEHFARIEEVVQESVRRGNDKSYLLKELSESYDISLRRARVIADDQTAKVTQHAERAQAQSLGLYKSVWRCSGISRNPRQDHLWANGKEFDNTVGLLINGEYVKPAEKPNCKCREQYVITMSNLANIEAATK